MLLMLLANLARMAGLVVSSSDVVPQWSYTDGSSNVYNANVIVSETEPVGSDPFVVSDESTFFFTAIQQAQGATTKQVGEAFTVVYQFAGTTTLYYSLTLTRIY